MSGLEKFQVEESWRCHFKNLLFVERKPKAESSVQEAKRFSLDLTDDFLAVLDQKQNSGCNKIKPDSLDVMENFREIKENIEIASSGIFLKEQQQTVKSKVSLSCSPSQLLKSTKPLRDYVSSNFNADEGLPFIKTPNDSFEAMEKMCNKSASDPNSTLFHYLEKKKQVVPRTPTCKEEADSLERLLYELKAEEELKKNSAFQYDITDETQLDDVEAPSRFWENTLSGETFTHASPTKLVGNLRPSTIVEECSDATESDSNSSASFYSALKSNEATECYDSAKENTESNDKSNASLNRFVDTTEKNYQSNAGKRIVRKSLNLIDLDTTFAPKEDFLQFSESSHDDSVIEILSDEEENSHNLAALDLKKETPKDNKIRTKFLKEKENNYSFNSSLENEKSLNFNDTIEEVEYMMKMGMQYMAVAKNNSPKYCTTASKLSYNLSESVNKKAKAFVKNPLIHSPKLKIHNNLSSPTLCKSINLLSSAKAKTNNRNALYIKPIPKLEIFKKPLQTDFLNKSISATKKKTYSHIISPVGAYIKKTPTTPLMSTIKPSSDILNSLTCRKLEYESRKMYPEFSVSNIDAKANALTGTACSLPKKAYISSELKHIVDERTPVTIPGGQKIQRYIQSSMLPAVVRHDGKIKVSAASTKPQYAQQLKTTKPPVARRTNDSLANLSLASGDVSLYTIRDARKF